MTQQQYGRYLGTVYGGMPGSLGMMGVVIGLRDGAWDRIVIGALFVLVGLLLASIFEGATKGRR